MPVVSAKVSFLFLFNTLTDTEFCFVKRRLVFCQKIPMKPDKNFINFNFEKLLKNVRFYKNFLNKF
jgi:hypothetical protein